MNFGECQGWVVLEKIGGTPLFYSNPTQIQEATEILSHVGAKERRKKQDRNPTPIGKSWYRVPPKDDVASRC